MTFDKAQTIADAIMASTDAVLKPCGVRILKSTLSFISTNELTTWAAIATGRLATLITKEQERRALLTEWNAYLQDD